MAFALLHRLPANIDSNIIIVSLEARKRRVPSRAIATFCFCNFPCALLIHVCHTSTRFNSASAVAACRSEFTHLAPFAARQCASQSRPGTAPLRPRCLEMIHNVNEPVTRMSSELPPTKTLKEPDCLAH